MLAHLKKIEELLTVLVRNRLSDVLDQELRDGNMRQLYELTGACTARELAQKTDLSIATISRVWQKWENLGLVIKEGKKYRRVL